MTYPLITSLEPIVNHQSKVLILGSMPGLESLRKQQYYGNPRNHFWGIMYKLFQQEELQDYREKMAFIKNHHIALWDVIYSCLREGSLDSNIKAEVPNDILGLLERYPNIQFIGFNGGKAYEVFKKKIGFRTLDINYKKLPSTSPVPGRNVKSFEEKLQDWKIIKEYV
ncbi:DNA-deoxyinosine glycosylase [Niallia endozanthoxylica]|uniref:DNA-deoxyinosine glycosylase n=1 Tax=Niallia endozanthoxylica TaxID=2036016 RepID=A0A5J5GTU4_9BACI|nr:DNA-deoxyinosine glycosylase [Niallia endozanthoxylica]KAA9011879.1 DNA-deoxyinosine glycosylase [Niallia endozanthoxylica]